MESIFSLGIMLSVIDKISAPLRMINGGITSLATRAKALGPTFDKFQDYGSKVAIAGGLMLGVLLSTVTATVASQQALGELASVGVRDFAALERAGASFSNSWSGTTKAQFIGAAYDIKSGISTLTDSGVADFTRLAALTGKATKSTTAEMTSLFATGYGIYKEAYANLSDLQFGELFSAGIAASVQAFKTTGSGMSQAIAGLGASATQNKVPLQEQLTILGMLQATMSGGEAGTKYRAMMSSAAEAGQRLGLPLVDANNQLLSMPDILNKLRGRYGDTLDAVEKIQIQKAFGTQEAVAVIDLLYGKVGTLTSNIQSMGSAMQQGTTFTEQMAAAMNADIGAGFSLTAQRLHNLVEIVGKQLIPVLAPLFAWFGNIIVAIGTFAEEHATLTRVVVLGAAVLGGLLFILGAVATAIGIIGLALPALASGWTAMGTALVWLKGAALNMLPALASFAAASWAAFVPWFLSVGWIVVAVVAIIAALGYLYVKFQVVRDGVHALLYALGFFAGAAFKFGKLLVGALLNPLGAIRDVFALVTNFIASINLFESGAKIIGTLAAGIGSMLSVPANLVRSAFDQVRQLLPFSDAKEGPLSSLTLSGARIMETLGAGVVGAAPGLQRTISTALAGAALATTVAIAPVADRPQAPVVTARAQSASSSGRSITIQNLTVTLPGVSNAEDFVSQLQALVEGYDV